MKKSLLIVATLSLFAVSCEDDDSSSSNRNLCESYGRKLQSCGLMTDGPINCNSYTGDTEDVCIANCFIGAFCDVLEQLMCSEEGNIGLESCIKACVQGFVCDNGEEISESWKCDGDEDCTDGSDEVGCPDYAEFMCPA